MRLGISSRLLTTLFLAIAVYAQSQPSDRDALIASAQKKAVQAVSFRQGDGASLQRARVDFTPEGWKSFIEHMQGFLDQKGAPTFTSSFEAAKEPVFLDEKSGVIHFRIPGTLRQTQGASRTTYRAALDIYALRDPAVHDGSSIKLQRLDQIIMYGRTSKVCQ